MCKRCNSIRILLQPWLNTEQLIYAYVDEDNIERHAISAGDPSYDIDIEYCPFCGRRLEER